MKPSELSTAERAAIVRQIIDNARPLRKIETMREALEWGDEWMRYAAECERALGKRDEEIIFLRASLTLAEASIREYAQRCISPPQPATESGGLEE